MSNTNVMIIYKCLVMTCEWTFVSQQQEVVRLNLHRLRIFLEVARHQSMSRAAEALYISQPAVSAQVSRLEEEVGIPLFRRMGREVILTSAGEVLRHYAERLLALANEVHHVMTHYREAGGGIIRVAATTTPGVYMLPRLLNHFQQEHPVFDIQVQIGNREQVLGWLRRFQTDLALVAGELDEIQELETMPILQERLIPIASPRIARLMIDGAARANVRLILRESGSGTRKLVEERLASTDVAFDNVMELPSTEAIKEAVIAGLGYSILSEVTIRRELDRGELIALDLPQLIIDRSIYLVFAKEKFISPILHRFINLVRAWPHG